MARIREGNDPEAPMAITSPLLSPAFMNRSIKRAAKSGLVAVLLAVKSPKVVVRGVHYSPISPVRLGSVILSMVNPFSTL